MESFRDSTPHRHSTTVSYKLMPLFVSVLHVLHRTAINQCIYSKTRYNEEPKDLENVFVMSRFFFKHFVTTGLKNMVRFIMVFVKEGFVTLGFHCI